MRNYSILLWGVFGSIGITIVFYLVQVLGMQSWTGPFYFMSIKWYFVLPLVVGFGIQMALFRAIHLKAKQGGGAVIASGGISTTAMIACCMHNLIPLLPIIGLAAISTFFSVYQDYVFGFSILFVIGGILYMWYKYNKLHACCEDLNKQKNEKS